jgi:hypothetical protein
MNARLLMSLLMLASMGSQVHAAHNEPPAADARLKHAQTALESARSSVAQSDPKAPRHGEAEAKLKEAEAHFQQARYEEAAQAADAAWKLLGEKSTPTRLSVMVDAKGETTVVKAVSGRVTVEGGGVTQVIENGASVQVDRDQPPRRSLGVPAPTQPGDKQLLSVKAVKTGLEPIQISWREVEGAESYEVELWPANGERRVVPVPLNSLQLPLAAGTYRWSVRALTRDTRSDASAPRDFEVREAPAKPIRLKVQPQKWK